MRALGLAGVPELLRIRAFKRDESEAEKFVGAAKAIFIQIQRV